MIIYKVVEKYRNNQEIGTWKYYNNNKLVRKEKYCNTTCKTRFYHNNGKLQKKGYTKLEVNNDSLHWYYYGKYIMRKANLLKQLIMQKTTLKNNRKIQGKSLFNSNAKLAPDKPVSANFLQTNNHIAN